MMADVTMADQGVNLVCVLLELIALTAEHGIIRRHHRRLRRHCNIAMMADKGVKLEIAILE